ncbi:MAG: YXWGXW repeat-containing protein [Bradyrhizobium sp.]|nr:YXWGXW repeat-containing protein [Bradyrhizobium sp.]
MRRIVGVSLAAALAFTGLTSPPPASAQLAVSISVDTVPPPLPVYVQPPIPAPGYIWSPGYWAWDNDIGYYWVPGTWVLPPQPDLLWTPPYWGWNDGVYVFHSGYWGLHVGFYGGIAYGGYTGSGYEGGYWRDRVFFYNRSVNNVTNVSITNVYNKTVVNNVVSISYNGGPGGTTTKPTQEQLAAAKEGHTAPTSEQARHADTARHDPSLHLANNHGHPSVAATPHPGQFKGAGIVAAGPGKPVLAPPLKHPPAVAALNPATKPGMPRAPQPKNAQAPSNHPAKLQAAPKPQPAAQLLSKRTPPASPVHAAKPRPIQLARHAPAPHRAPPPPRRPPPPHVARPAPPRRPPPSPRRPPPPPRPHPQPRPHRAQQKHR